MSNASEIQELWAKIKQLNSDWHQEDVSEFFSPPASESEIQEAERVLGFQMPEELRAGFRCHNGVVGAWDAYDFLYLEELPSMVEAYQQQQDHFGATPRRVVGPVEQVFMEKGRFPISFGYDWLYMVDMIPADGGTVGQVIRACPEESAIEVVAVSYGDYLKQGIEWLNREISSES